MTPLEIKAGGVVLLRDRTLSGLVAVLAIYAVLYVAIIVAGHGLPYVMDNNETFSSLNHAYNLWHFNFLNTFGLTDEAASPSALAHPMIHTHQGNFPRLFSFLLFAVGARSAENQIVITTFTVGVASVIFGLLFLRRLAGELFATVAMALLVTDYLLFAQWQVNTYRVWSGFLLFGIYLSVLNAERWKFRNWCFATVALYAALFYGELVFAAFVSVAAAVFALLTYWRKWARIFSIWAVSGVGALVGIGTLAVQLVLFMGWRAALTDFELTLTARNYAPSNIEFFKELNSFYAHHNVIFLNNIVSTDQYSGLLRLLQLGYQDIFQFHTPVFCLAAGCLCLSLYASDRRGPLPADTAVESRAVDRLCTFTVAFGVAFFLCSVLFLENALGPVVSLHSVAVRLLLLLGIFVISVPVGRGFRHLAALASPTGTPPAIQRCARGATFLIGCAALIVLQDVAFDSGAQRDWLQGVFAPPMWAAKGIVVIAASAGLVVVLAGRKAFLGKLSNVPERLLPFFVSGLVAYCFIYYFAGGYLETGYLQRLAPLPVFHADVFLALAPFLLAAASAWLVFQNCRVIAPVRKMSGVIAGCFGIGLLVIWCLVQYRLLIVAPPDQFAFIRLLQPSLAQGHGLASNNYAAPFGYVAKTWAYTDPLLGATPDPSGERHTVSYLWFADRASNSEYFKPGLFVCFQGLSTLQVLLNRTRRDAGQGSNCSSMPLVHRAFSNAGGGGAVQAGALHEVRLVPIARDETHGRWAIVKLDWQR